MAPDDATRGDTALIVCLAAGMHQREAARKARVSRSTIARRMRDPTFRAAIAEARTAMLSEALGRLAATSASAADRLAVLLRAEDEGTQLRAAKTILEVALKLRDAVELSERVAALEALAEPGKGEG